MKLSERVARRHLAKVLDKSWLMAVKRGWNALLEQLKVGSKERDEQTFGAMHTFLANLEEQIRFVQRAMFVTITHSDPAGRAFHETLKKLKEEITRVDELSAKIRKEAEFFSERYRKEVDKLVQEKGGTSLYKLLPESAWEHVVTQDHEDAVIIQNFPQLEESLKQQRYADKIFQDWVRGGGGFDVEKGKLNKRFDAVMKLLYEEARKLKELQGQGQEVEDEEVFTQFELYGVKVVVDDRTVAPIQVKQYVKYLDKTYALLKAKHLEKVWYGTFFIKCEDCGGFNQNTQRWNDVGGNYPIGPDVVNIFSRPSSFIVELLAHELGHRYWFKFLTEGQRGKFESLVKAHKKMKPRKENFGTPLVIPQEKRVGAKRRVEEAIAAVNEGLHKFQEVKKTKNMWWKKSIEVNYQAVASMGHKLFNDMLDAVHSAGANSTINPEVKRLFDDTLNAVGVVQKKLVNLDPDLIDKVNSAPELDKRPKSLDAYYWKIYEVQRDIWIREVQHELGRVEQAAKEYIDQAVAAFNAVENERYDKALKEYEDEYAQDTRPVPAVSNYGQSNIDEAFAEAFMHYVVEMDMTQDQIESFKEVFKHASLAERVADRFVERSL